MTSHLYSAIDRQRKRLGYLTIEEVLLLCERNEILDPFSVLLSQGVCIGTGNVLFPNVALTCKKAGNIVVGDGNVFHPGFYALADEGSIAIGDQNQFGDGPVGLKANVAGTCLVVESHGRYQNGVVVMGHSHLGTGTQLLGGMLTVQDCLLAPGDSHLGDDPDRRGAVIKGFGFARGLELAAGEVINGRGHMDAATMVERQSTYHPRARQA
jgi:hypothetical protein